MRGEFRPGVYRHYKGGLYTALFLVTHHETREPMVVYVSHEKGHMNCRPLNGWSSDSDAWNDAVEHEGKWVPRFERIE